MRTTSALTAYIMCGTPRTGSTLLCSLLRATGVAGRPESYFREPDEQLWARHWSLPTLGEGVLEYRELVRAAVKAGSTDNGVFGARVMWGTMDHLVARLAAGRSERALSDLDLVLAELGPTRFVHLRREDTVAQAVSWVRAEASGYWQQGDTPQPGWQPGFDAAAIRDTVATIREHDAAWCAWFARHAIRPHVVRYEDLVQDMAGVTRTVLDFLGLELLPGTTLRPREQRHGDAVNDDWIAAYRSLTAGGG